MKYLRNDGSVRLNQMQLVELFATSKQNISVHINNMLKENELDANSGANYYLTTAAEGAEANASVFICSIRTHKFRIFVSN